MLPCELHANANGLLFLRGALQGAAASTPGTPAPCGARAGQSCTGEGVRGRFVSPAVLPWQRISGEVLSDSIQWKKWIAVSESRGVGFAVRSI